MARTKTNKQPRKYKPPAKGPFNPHGGKRPVGKKTLPPGPELAQRKPRRLRPGTAALREIRREVQSIGLSIPKSRFAKVVRDILVNEDTEITCRDRNPLLPTKVDGKKNLRATQNFRVTPQSLQVLHTAAESFLVNVFQVSMNAL